MEDKWHTIPEGYIPFGINGDDEALGFLKGQGWEALKVVKFIVRPTNDKTRLEVARHQVI